MTTNTISVATAHMIDAAEAMIRAGHNRFFISRSLHDVGATIGQIDDAIRAARHAIPFSTKYLALTR